MKLRIEETRTCWINVLSVESGKQLIACFDVGFADETERKVYSK